MYRTMILALGLTVGTGAVALADSAWTGGDNLPTNALACDATPGTAAAAPMTAASRPARRT